MSKLKLGVIEDDKPVRVTAELPAQVHRDLVAYAQAMGGALTTEPAKLIGPMLARFMASDRVFSQAKRAHNARK